MHRRTNEHQRDLQLRLRHRRSGFLLNLDMGKQVKYRDNMSAEETAQLLAEIKDLDDSYQDQVVDSTDDEMTILKKAALNLGQP